jgi:hypothetical protein
MNIYKTKVGKEISNNISYIYYIYLVLFIFNSIYYKAYYLPNYLYFQEMKYSVSITFLQRFNFCVIYYFILTFLLLICSVVLIFFSNIFIRSKIFFGKNIYIFFITPFILLFIFMANFFIFIKYSENFYSLFYYFKNFENIIFLSLAIITTLTVLLITDGDRTISFTLQLYLTIPALYCLRIFENHILFKSNILFILTIICLIILFLYLCNKEKVYLKINEKELQN